MPFTTKMLDALKPRAKQYRKMEGKARPGFGVQVSPGGKVAFIYLYRTPDVKNRQRVMTLGEYKGMGRAGVPRDGGMSLKGAYQDYDHWKRVRDSGRDPQFVRDDQLRQEEEERQARLAQQIEEAAKGSIQQLLNAYVDDMREEGRRSWSTVKQDLEANVYKVIPPDLKAKDVTQVHIRQVLANIQQRGALILANRVRAYLSAAFTFGIEWDHDSARHYEALRFGISVNPVRDIPKPVKKEKPRKRFLDETEAKRVWDALGESNFHPRTIAALRLLLALGQRVEEILKLHVNDVDFKSRIVIFRDTKNGTDHVVPFGSVAEAILKERVCDMNDEGALFGKIRGAEEGGIMVSTTLSHATRKLCKRIEIPHFQPKDMRRTVKTLMGRAGIRKEDRDRFQNHALKQDVSSENYDWYDYLLEKRQTIEIWDEYLQGILAGNAERKIVPLRSAFG